MSSYYRKSIYLCRAPLCKHKNEVWARVDSVENVIDMAPAWKGLCGGCGRGSFDLIFQKTFRPK